MEPLLLYGQYEVALDPKNRLPIPACVRRQIKPESHGKDFFLVVGQNRRPWLFPSFFYGELVARQQSELMPSPEVSECDRMNLALAQLVELDPQGRILVPVRSMSWTGLQQSKELYLLGVRDHLELWDKTAWEHERVSLVEHGPEIVARARQARQIQQDR